MVKSTEGCWRVRLKPWTVPLAWASRSCGATSLDGGVAGAEVGVALGEFFGVGGVVQVGGEGGVDGEGAEAERGVLAEGVEDPGGAGGAAVGFGEEEGVAGMVVLVGPVGEVGLVEVGREEVEGGAGGLSGLSRRRGRGAGDRRWGSGRGWRRRRRARR